MTDGPVRHDIGGARVERRQREVEGVYWESSDTILEWFIL